MKKFFKSCFWISFFMTLSGSLLADLLGASTFWSIVIGIVLANIVNIYVFFRFSTDKGF